MATSSLSPTPRRREKFSLTPEITIEAAATALFILMPEPGKAQVDACSGTIQGVNPLRDSTGNIQTLDVTLNDGTKYTPCTIKAKPTADVLKQTPWHAAPGTSLATDLANSVFNQITSFVGAPTYASADPLQRETNWFYEGINNSGDRSGESIFIGDGPYFWRSENKAVAYQTPGSGFLCDGSSSINNSCNIKDLDNEYIFTLGADPGPLPLLGAVAAFGWSRRLRRRSRTSAKADSTSLRALRVASSREAGL